jgi:uncharacterized membrane protein
MAPTPYAVPVSPPLHVVLGVVPVACFVGTLITDLVYWQTANMQWANFSAWLLAIGLLVAVLVVIAGVIDVLFRRGIRDTRGGWVHVLGYAVVIVLEIFNSFIHSRDAYTSVVPTGLILSLLTVLLLLATGWYGWWQTRHAATEVRP